MKRSGPPKRRKPLRPDPEKVREFQRRAQEKARETAKRPGKGSTRLKRSKPQRPAEGPLSVEDYCYAVWALDRGECRGCGRRVPRGLIPHHPLPKQHLRKRKLYDVVWDPANGILLCETCHGNHESRAAVVPGDRLPARALEFVAARGSWAVEVLERAHPGSAEQLRSLNEGDRA
jgi:hypothetical protein